MNTYLFEYFNLPYVSSDKVNEEERKLRHYHVVITKEFFRENDGFYTSDEVAEHLFPGEGHARHRIKNTVEWLEDNNYLYLGEDRDDKPTYCWKTYWKRIHGL